MMRRATSPALRLTLLALACLVSIHQTAPWPVIQTLFHTILVLGLAPEFRSRLVAVLWASAAGWVLEGSLRLLPHLGGTALANMGTVLVLGWTLAQWPPRDVKVTWVRLGGAVIGHTVLVHFCVRLAAGPHLWGWGWLLSLVLVPLWGSLVFKLHRPVHGR